MEGTLEKIVLYNIDRLHSNIEKINNPFARMKNII